LCIYETTTTTTTTEHVHTQKKKVLHAVERREELLMAERSVRKVEEERLLGRRLLRESLEEKMTRAQHEGRDGLTTFEEEELILLKQRLEDEYLSTSKLARSRLEKAMFEYEVVRKEQVKIVLRCGHEYIYTYIFIFIFLCQ
jgi:hypothetical protein